MKIAGLSIPPPRDDDHEDVAWALRAAAAQWNRESYQDAIAWVQRAAETADEVREYKRAAELFNLVDALKGESPQKAVAPPPPKGVAPPPPRAPQQTLGINVDVELDDAEDVDELLEDDLVFDDDDGAEPVESAEEDTERPPSPPSSVEPPTEKRAASAAPPPEPHIAERAPPAAYRVSSPDLQIGEASLDDLDLGDLASQLDSRPEHGAIEGVESPFEDEATTDHGVLPEEDRGADEDRGDFEKQEEADTFDEDEPPTAPIPLPPESARSSKEPFSFAGPASEPSPPPDAPLPRSAFPPSGPPPEPFPLAPSAHVPDVEELARAEASGPAAGEPASVDGILLEGVSGLADLPEDSQAELARGAELCSLSAGEEARTFAVALVTAGSVDIMPAIADASCARARRGEVVFTQGTLGEGVQLRVVGAEPGTRVAIWNAEQLTAATAACPWVADELLQVADRYQALAGAVMGPLGDSLDDMFRPMVLEKCTVRRYGPGDVLLEKGKPVDGMYIVGAGWVELLEDDGSVREELGPGDFMFRATILAAGKASHTARAGQGGALMLFAPRMSTHELLATCPPFIELVAG